MLFSCRGIKRAYISFLRKKTTTSIYITTVHDFQVFQTSFKQNKINTRTIIYNHIYVICNHISRLPLMICYNCSVRDIVEYLHNVIPRRPWLGTLPKFLIQYWTKNFTKFGKNPPFANPFKNTILSIILLSQFSFRRLYYYCCCCCCCDILVRYLIWIH